MKLTKGKKIILMIVLTAFVVLLFNSNTVFAAINEEYATLDPVTDATLEDAFNDSTLLNLLAKLVYAVGQFLEWILGTIFSLLTGSSDFPWADKIVFNSVPLLDINFINPDDQSFVGQTTITTLLKDLYATIMTLAVAFFGIVVLITAIRLVISTIAADKAKYKQAIVNWLVGFVTLFCIHYAISLIFYLNEELVKVASKLVMEQLDKKEAAAHVESSKNATDLIESMGDTVYNGTYKGNTGVKIKDILTENQEILEVYINLDSNDNANGIHEFLMKEVKSFVISWDKAITQDEQKQRLAAIIVWARNENISVKDLKKIREERIYVVKLGLSYYQAIRDEDVEQIFKGQYYRFEAIHDGMRMSRTEFSDFSELAVSTTSTSATRNLIKSDTYLWCAGGANEISNVGWSVAASCPFRWDILLHDLIQLKSASPTSSGEYSAATGKKMTLISDLASYFKYNAAEKTFRTTNITGLKDSGNINIQNMLMYTILVCQSLVLFIAYVKRLFYVVLLAMMAPIVVVFDFFQKFGK